MSEFRPGCVISSSSNRLREGPMIAFGNEEESRLLSEKQLETFIHGGAIEQ